MELETKQKELVELLTKEWEGQLKPLVDKLESEIKARGEATAETKQLEERIDTKLDELEVRFEKLGLDEKAENEGATQRKAFNTFLRKGMQHKDVQALLETKDLIESDDTSGGALAPTDYFAEIIKGITEQSAVRQVARVMTTSRQSVQIPKRITKGTATWANEQETRTESAGPTFGLEEIPTYELYSVTDVSNWLVEDAAFDIENELALDATEQFGVAEETGFVSGNAVKKPEGFLVNADVVAAAVPTATNDTFVADDLIELYFALKSGYEKNATWMLNRSILKVVRKFKDGVTGAYVWQPGLATVSPATILDRPYIMSPDMASAVADAAIVAAFGDFYSGYRIVDHVNLVTQRDPFTQATAGAIRYVTRKRVGGQVVLPEAIKILKVA